MQKVCNVFIILFLYTAATAQIPVQTIRGYSELYAVTLASISDHRA